MGPRFYVHIPAYRKEESVRNVKTLLQGLGTQGLYLMQCEDLASHQDLFLCNDIFPLSSPIHLLNLLLGFPQPYR